MKEQTHYSEPNIQRYGCLFVSLLAFGEMIATREKGEKCELSDDQVSFLYRHFQALGNGFYSYGVDALISEHFTSLFNPGFGR